MSTIGERRFKEKHLQMPLELFSYIYIQC